MGPEADEFVYWVGAFAPTPVVIALGVAGVVVAALVVRWVFRLIGRRFD